GSMSMGRNLVLWFIYTVVVSFFAAYVAGRALPPHSDYLEVFRFAGVAAFLTYAGALWPMSIWYRRAWSATIKATIDGLIYAGFIAGTFGLLLPMLLLNDEGHEGLQNLVFLCVLCGLN